VNLALSTFMLFGLLIPGISWRKTYFANEFSHQYVRTTFFSLFLSTLIPSILFQTIWYFLSDCTDYEVDLETFFSFLSGNFSKKASENIKEYAPQIILYNSTMWLVAATFGWFLRKLIRFRQWDLRFKWLRYNNRWHYLLGGEILWFAENPIDASPFTLTDIDITHVELLTIDEALYIGTLADYQLGKDGGLSSVTLTDVHGEQTIEDSSDEPSMTQLGGTVTVFDYSNIQYINCTYYKLGFTENLEPKITNITIQ
jgi:hypothetical protein